MSVIRISDVVGGGYNDSWKTRKFYKVIKGGRGSKKSVTTQLELIYKMMKYPWMNCIVARRYQNTLRDSVYVGLKWACSRLGVSYLWDFKVSPMEATYLPTGQKILFRGFDDAIKLTSIQLEKGLITHLWVEEAYELESRDKLDTVVEGMRGILPDGAFRQVILTFNPWSENHWIKSEFFDVEDDDVFATTTTYKCNEFLDEATVKRYEKLFETNPRRANIVCNGEWGIAEGLVYDNVSFERLDKEELAKKGFKLLIGLDFGFTHDPTALIVAYLDEDSDTLYIVDEHYETGMHTKDIALMIKKKGFSKSTIVADCAEKRLISELRYDYDIRRIKECQKGKDSIRQGIDKLQSLKIICDDRLVNCKAEFFSYAYKYDKVAGKFINEAVDANNHLMDALRYSLQCMDAKTMVRMFSGGI